MRLLHHRVEARALLSFSGLARTLLPCSEQGMPKLAQFARRLMFLPNTANSHLLRRATAHHVLGSSVGMAQPPPVEGNDEPGARGGEASSSGRWQLDNGFLTRKRTYVASERLWLIVLNHTLPPITRVLWPKGAPDILTPRHLSMMPASCHTYR
jgi:hypothetical protein